jgi:hypothetical protein
VPPATEEEFMKKGFWSFAAPVTVALVLGLAVYAVPAMGTSTSLASRVTKLEAANKRILAANKQIVAANVKLAKRVTALESFNSCNDNVAPVTVSGDPTNGAGFEYTPDNKVTVTLLRGFSPTDQGQKPDDYLQLVDADCVASSPAPFGAVAHRSH